MPEIPSSFNPREVPLRFFSQSIQLPATPTELAKILVKEFPVVQLSQLQSLNIANEIFARYKKGDTVTVSFNEEGREGKNSRWTPMFI